MPYEEYRERMAGLARLYLIQWLDHDSMAIAAHRRASRNGFDFDYAHVSSLDDIKACKQQKQNSVTEGNLDWNW
jgi:hypothetical protein